MTAVAGGTAPGVVALREVTVPGLDAQQEAELPGTGVAPTTDVHFRADSGRRACTGAGASLRCDPELSTVGDESTGLRRVFRTSTTGTWSLTGTVVATPSPSTLELLDPLGDAARVRASSTLGNDPLVAPAFAHDGDPATWWSSAVGDAAPSLTVSWGPERLLTGIRVELAQTSRVPKTAVVDAGGIVQKIILDGSGMARLSPVRGTELTISFPLAEGSSSSATIPLAIAEVELDGVQDLAYRPDRASATGAPCGLGPRLTLDGRTVETEVRGRIADVLDGTALEVLPCSALGPLGGGEHRLIVLSTDRFVVTSATMTAEDTVEPVVGGRTFAVDEWQATHRVVTVGPGADSILRVTENANPGWQAMLNGRPLDSLVLDGWQQGYAVPSGEGGIITLQFAPDGPYRAGLMLGAGLVVLLAISTLIAVMHGARRPAPGPYRARWTQLEDRITVRAALVVGAIIAGGAPLAGGALGGSLLTSRAMNRLVIAGACLAGAGALSAVSLFTGNGPSSGPADLIAGVGLGMMLAALPSTAPKAVPQEDTA